jgi:DNA repair exonuclease SbcCD nuclease subunit
MFSGMTTNIFHISDTHLGNRQYGSDIRRDDFARAFNQAIGNAVKAGADAVIHTGDLFDTRDPALPDINRCIDILEQLDDAGIPFYGIVGNHERKMDEQYLDLLSRVGVAERLGKSPTLVNGEVALYGIDAVTKPAWHAEDFTLEEPSGDAFTILCMHQLLHPPVPEIMSEHPLRDVIDRVNIDVDAVALGDYHEAKGTVEQGTQVWYAGSTERCASGEESPRSISQLEIDGQTLTRTRKELDTRPFLSVNITFADDDGFSFAENVIDRHDVEEKVVLVTVEGERSTVTSSDIREIVMNRGAAVCDVDDQRGGPDIDLSDGPTGEIQSADRLIENKLSEENLSGITLEIEERVRTDDPTARGFDDEVEERVSEAQQEAFADENEPAATEEEA